jgi:hypothetical protein
VKATIRENDMPKHSDGDSTASDHGYRSGDDRYDPKHGTNDQ